MPSLKNKFRTRCYPRTFALIRPLNPFRLVTAAFGLPVWQEDGQGTLNEPLLRQPPLTNSFLRNAFYRTAPTLQGPPLPNYTPHRVYNIVPVHIYVAFLPPHTTARRTQRGRSYRASSMDVQAGPPVTTATSDSAGLGISLAATPTLPAIRTFSSAFPAICHGPTFPMPRWFHSAA